MLLLQFCWISPVLATTGMISSVTKRWRRKTTWNREISISNRHMVSQSSFLMQTVSKWVKGQEMVSLHEYMFKHGAPHPMQLTSAFSDF